MDNRYKIDFTRGVAIVLLGCAVLFGYISSCENLFYGHSEKKIELKEKNLEKLLKEEKPPKGSPLLFPYKRLV